MCMYCVFSSQLILHLVLAGTVTRSFVSCSDKYLRHTHNKTADNIPTFKSLHAELSRSCEDGHQALDVLHTMERFNYPIDSNIVCRLLSISTKFNNKDMFTTVLDLTDKHVPYYAQVYTSVINGLLTFSGFEDAMQVYSEMISKGITPRSNLICNLFNYSMKRDDIKNTAILLDKLLARCILPSLTSIEEFLTMCLNHRLHYQVVKLLEFHSTFNLPVGDALANQLMVYFSSYRDM